MDETAPAVDAGLRDLAGHRGGLAGIDGRGHRDAPPTDEGLGARPVGDAAIDEAGEEQRREVDRFLPLRAGVRRIVVARHPIEGRRRVLAHARIADRHRHRREPVAAPNIAEAHASGHRSTSSVSYRKSTFVQMATTSASTWKVVRVVMKWP